MLVLIFQPAGLTIDPQVVKLTVGKGRLRAAFFLSEVLFQMNDADAALPLSDRALTALCYVSGIVPVYGLLFAGGVWALNKRSNPWLAGHAFQAAAAGAIFLGLLFVPGASYAISSMLAAMRAPFAHFAMFLSHALLKLIFVASWIGFSYGALEAFRTGTLPWRICRVDANVEQR